MGSSNPVKTVTNAALKLNPMTVIPSLLKDKVDKKMDEMKAAAGQAAATSQANQTAAVADTAAQDAEKKRETDILAAMYRPGGTESRGVFGNTPNQLGTGRAKLMGGIRR
jgi:hypothetical protein